MRIKPSVKLYLKTLRFLLKRNTQIMKPILIILIFAEIYGAFSTNITLQGQRETTDIGDFVSSIAQELDETIGTVSIAVTNAIHNVKLWTGGNVDARLNLLT